MSAGCVRWLLSRTGRTLCSSRPGYWAPASPLAICSERHNLIAGLWRRSPLSTEAGDTEQTFAPKKKKQDPRAHGSVSSVGRKIPQREIRVISETGENLGIMHRADVIRVMDEKSLKLVLVSENKDPAVYKLMSGKQIHEEQLKQREKNKAKAAPVQVKELTFSAGITAHDVITKLKQVESWLEKKHHVKITLRAGHVKLDVDLGTALEQMVEQMGVTVGFVAKPKVRKDGQAATCILRPPSAKELSQKEKSEAAELHSSSEVHHSQTPPASSTDTTAVM